jgi:hypothetical protein
MTAPAPTEREAKRERVVKAAVEWVYDQSCSNALMELEDAVTEFIGHQLYLKDRPPMTSREEAKQPMMTREDAASSEAMG